MVHILYMYRSAQPFPAAVKHGADKCMCGSFSTLIFTVKYVDPRRKLHILVPDLPEIFYF